MVVVFQLYAALVDRLFDLRYGLDTCAWAELSDLTLTSPIHAKSSKRYQPTRLVPLRRLLRCLSADIPPNSVLVDFGCGKGRVLLAASEFGFREVRGVEFARELCEIARHNCASYRARRGIECEFRVIDGDVTDYVVETDENVFFLFNPFDETILARVLDNIEASIRKKPRRVLIIYYYPDYADVIDRRAGFSRIRELEVWHHKFVVYSNCELTACSDEARRV